MWLVCCAQHHRVNQSKEVVVLALAFDGGGWALWETDEKDRAVLAAVVRDTETLKLQILLLLLISVH